MRKLALSIVFLLAAASAFAQGDVVKITILHLNDTYQMTPADGGKRGGLARVLTVRKRVLQENPNTLVTLGGDTVSPSVETRTYRGAQMIDGWNAVGLDYAVFGNHEFDIKTNELLDRIKESKFTWLGANVIDTKTDKTFGGTPQFVIRSIG
ncbi:MAG TPA: metallophosphoesterase, partial [Pyrinomonadaceae bacterium]|nr:metallophosphoesterase [Pyrinomonadaceae bacterium]